MNKMEEGVASIRKHLLEAEESTISASLKPLIEKWSNNPTPVEVLEVLDRCIFSSLSNGFVIRLLQMLYENMLISHDTTNEEVIKLATWREKL